MSCIFPVGGSGSPLERLCASGNGPGKVPWGEEVIGQATEFKGDWSRIRDILRAEIGNEAFDTWLAGLEFRSIESATAILAARTPFIRDWVQRHYLDRISDVWRGQNEKVLRVSVVAARRSADSAAILPRTTAVEAGRGQSHLNKDSYGGTLDPRFTFDSFVVGKSNELAYAAARRVADSGEVPFNPLFLHGGVGLGKTHLMHAIAAQIRSRQPDRRIMYLSAEKFMFQFITALRYKDTVAFKKQFRSVDVLMIDDVQFIANKNSTQEEFFHTFNALIDNRRQVIISADRSPTDLRGVEERIVSRLGWGLVADVHPTDYELRLGILQSKCDSIKGAQVAIDVLEFLARRITSNVRELEGALNRVVAYATLVGRPITLEMTSDVLQDLLRANDRKVSIEEIQHHVAEYYNLRLSELLSPRRARNIARPRQVAMFLAKQMTTRSLPEIGRKFGGRDHTTVIHAVRKITELRCTESGLDEDIIRLSRQLES